MKFKNIEQCSDKKYLFDNLNENSLKEIDRILEAYWNNQIDILVPGRDTGDYDLSNSELIVKDKGYRENGFELLVIKWIEDWEDTGYLVDCFKDMEDNTYV